MLRVKRMVHKDAPLHSYHSGEDRRALYLAVYAATFSALRMLDHGCTASHVSAKQEANNAIKQWDMEP